jgi:DNA-binding transcriptional LysR family regulator
MIGFWHCSGSRTPEAARELGLSQPSVSRVFAALERDLGVQLLIRTTRTLELTRAGKDYLARVESALAILEAAGHAERGEGELRGVLRLALPAKAAIREVIPRLEPFLAEHPALRMDYSLDDRRQDLVRDVIDVAIRFGFLEDFTATSCRIDVNARLLAASASLFENVSFARARWSCRS